MRIKSISLTNVRRFTEPVRINGLNEGLNVLCEPNEYGKSTLFDALQALFFKSHTSSDKQIKSLRPHAGGAPEVAVEVEIEAGVFNVTKRWMSKPLATIEQSGHLIRQAGEAEAWISELVGGGDGGPSGLLWVRQGLTTLSEGTNKEREVALEVRRDLLSSVTGEVEAMTGGRRMDHALARCKKELSAFATASGRPKTGGPWKEAVDKVDGLRTDHKELSDQVSSLRDHLDERGRLRRELSELEDPEASTLRKKRVSDATLEFQTAQRHAQAVESETLKVEAARLAVTNLNARLESFRSAIKERDEATEIVRTASEKAEASQLVLKTEREKHAAAQKAFDQANADHKTAREEVRIAQQHKAAVEGKERREELTSQIENAQLARSLMEEAAAEASKGPSASVLRQLEGLAAAVASEQALLNSESAKLVMNYEERAIGRVKYDGEDLPAGEPVAIPHGASLHIEEIGTLSIHTGDGAKGVTGIEEAEQALANALAPYDCTTIDEAREFAAKRDAAERRHLEAKATFESLASKGIDDLRAKLAAIPQIDAAQSDVPKLELAERRLLEADEARSEAETARTIAIDRLSDARAEASKLDAAFEAAQSRLSRAVASLDAFGEIEEDGLADELTRAVTALSAAEAVHAEKERNAPNLKAVEAALKRAQSIEDAARTQIARLRPALAALEANISRSADEAVEERLVETEQKLEAAEAHCVHIETEVAVLQELQSVLEDARSEAHERYFEPVATELKPLLQLLWPDATLLWDDKDLLPTALVRKGQEEPIDVLSGGTKEQVSLLVRLAFARMLAKRGQSAPIILDDALVFTDDDRIERMFDALHEQASDLQILVLSCRQRAFRELGGNVLHLE